MPQPNRIGRYEVLGLIGGGGMGKVYKARDPNIGGRFVAIKLLRTDFVVDESDSHQLRQRFTQEAHAAGRLQSDYIVQIFDVGEHDGEPYIAMEFIDGETLAAVIKRREPWPLRRKLDVIAQLCDGVASAHDAGIVHRDIKPLNLVIDRRGRLKILDFGIAKMADSGMHTMTGASMGSANYMSPEQINASKLLDHRTDVFSIGAVLYELISYRQAFPGPPPGVLHRILHETPEPLSLLDGDTPLTAPEVADRVERIVNRALQKDPDARYRTIEEMAGDIRSVAESLATATTPAAAIQPLQSAVDSAAASIDVPEPAVDTPQQPSLSAALISQPGPGWDTTVKRPAMRVVSDDASQVKAESPNEPIVDARGGEVTTTAASRPVVRWTLALVAAAAIVAGGAFVLFGKPSDPGYAEVYAVAPGVVVSEWWNVGAENFWLTSDSGNTWKSLPLPAGFSKSFVDHGPAGLVLWARRPDFTQAVFTPEARSGWRSVNLTGDPSFSVGSAVFVGDTVLARDVSGSLYTHREDNWILVNGNMSFDSGPGSIVRAAMIGSSVVLVTDKQFVSTDSGAHWERFALEASDATAEQALILGDRFSGFKLLVVQSGRLWARDFDVVPGAGVRAASAWQERQVIGDGPHTGLHIASDTKPGVVWATAADSLLRSDDYGTSWSTRSKVSSRSLWVSSFAATDQIVYVGIEGAVLTARENGQSWSCFALVWAGCRLWEPAR